MLIYHIMWIHHLNGNISVQHSKCILVKQKEVNHNGCNYLTAEHATKWTWMHDDTMRQWTKYRVCFIKCKKNWQTLSSSIDLVHCFVS